MSDSNPSKTSVHPAITSLLASLKLGKPQIHKGIGLWPVFADCRPEPAYLITKPFREEAVKAAISQALFFRTTAPAE